MRRVQCQPEIDRPQTSLPVPELACPGTARYRNARQNASFAGDLISARLARQEYSAHVGTGECTRKGPDPASLGILGDIGGAGTPCPAAVLDVLRFGRDQITLCAEPVE